MVYLLLRIVVLCLQVFQALEDSEINQTTYTFPHLLDHPTPYQRLYMSNILLKLICIIVKLNDKSKKVLQFLGTSLIVNQYKTFL